MRHFYEKGILKEPKIDFATWITILLLGVNKSYDDSVKLKRTEMDSFRLGVREWSRTESRQSQREPVPDYID